MRSGSNDILQTINAIIKISNRLKALSANVNLAQATNGLRDATSSYYIAMDSLPILIDNLFESIKKEFQERKPVTITNDKLLEIPLSSKQRIDFARVLMIGNQVSAVIGSLFTVPGLASIIMNYVGFDFIINETNQPGFSNLLERHVNSDSEKKPDDIVAEAAFSGLNSSSTVIPTSSAQTPSMLFVPRQIQSIPPTDPDEDALTSSGNILKQ